MTPSHERRTWPDFIAIIIVGTMAFIIVSLFTTCAPAHSSEHVVTLPSDKHARLMPHFTAKEFACKHCGIRKVSGNLLYKLELLRKELNSPIYINSGYRCEHHNKEVGGAKYSQHQLGRAADIRVKGYTPKQVAQSAKKIGFSFIKIYKYHVHVDVR